VNVVIFAKKPVAALAAARGSERSSGSQYPFV